MEISQPLSIFARSGTRSGEPAGRGIISKMVPAPQSLPSRALGFSFADASMIAVTSAW